ncbi:MEMO1 family protein [Geobacter sp. OR-1]|uniref:AmmeMemoRadiSam system protein B n=1 Tax=Geobacter sp. OR-1 TaxID=1266765 RepID=UPI000543940D|nr:AmmeMemoRadiSam system protein B [Geobacter sp. OR-1]GAM09241.1 MEMO1 family protein [Geobacter sp. OR-1]
MNGLFGKIGRFLKPVVFCCTLFMSCGCSAEIKEPAVAGAFYPGDKAILQKTVDGFMASAGKQEAQGRLLTLLAPHAGYQFSGAVAANSYAQLKGSGVTTVILLGPSHYTHLNGAAVYAKGSFRTPLGLVAVNEKIAAQLLDKKSGVVFDRNPFAREHSLEVQLPFIQRVLPAASIVPVIVGAPTRESYQSLAESLAKALKDPKTVLIVSSDLSHYHDRETAGQMDRTVIDAVERLSVNDLEGLLSNGNGEACGGYPLIYALAAVRSLGATNGQLYRYADSGDVTGDNKKVVGYAAMGIYRSSLALAEKRELVALARRSLDSHVNKKPFVETPPSTIRLKADGASFVTINDKSGNLRGCIGNIIPMMPLARSVVMNARSAASHDPRFPPVRPEELPGLHLEVTVLSPLEVISDIGAVTIGTHGLYLEKGGKSAVFLPQVPVEQGWNRAVYLEQLSLKAGLPADGWKRAKLSRFTAEVVKE